MPKFEIVNKYIDKDIHLPVRKTLGAAGYDFEVAEDIIVPPYGLLSSIMQQITMQEAMSSISLINPGLITGGDQNPNDEMINIKPKTLAELGEWTKTLQTRPTLVPTGIKCNLPTNKYLEISMRSSSPLKYWLIMANGVGIIDSDYYNCEETEGEIFFQVINLSPVEIQLRKGDVIGQGIIKSYSLIDNDNVINTLRVGGMGSTDA